jgi:hypothetical protein
MLDLLPANNEVSRADRIGVANKIEEIIRSNHGSHAEVSGATTDPELLMTLLQVNRADVTHAETREAIANSFDRSWYRAAPPSTSIGP